MIHRKREKVLTLIQKNRERGRVARKMRKDRRVSKREATPGPSGSAKNKNKSNKCFQAGFEI